VAITEGAIIGGKFKLERPLAQGGMGSVWVARHQLLDSDVAVKFMEKSIAENESARQRFEREAKAAALIKSPHVVQVLDYGIEEGSPYIAMELLDGEDLDHRLSRGGPLTLEKAYVILEQAGKALRRAHELGIVHRDLKPSNIFLSKHGDEELVKILDFGIAKDISATTSASATSTGALLGSPSYMSPEQIRETKHVDHRSDIWSMGVILYEVLTGRLPFDESENIGKLLVSICTDPVLPASVLVPTFGVEVDRFFEKALSRDRATRFQSMAELVEAFGACAGVRPARTTLLIGADKRDGKIEDISETAKTLSLEPVAAKSADRASGTRLEGPETRGSLAPSESGDHGGSSRKKFVPIVLGVVAVVGALGFVFVNRNSDAGAKGPESENTASKSTVETTAAAMPSISAAAALREVTIPIDPPDATVEVAGRVVPVGPNGTITISGELGSSHPVRIYKDKLEFRTEVAIMAKGPVPDKLALPAKPAASTVAAVVTTTTTAPTVVAKPKDPGPGPTTAPTPTTTKTTKPPPGDPGPVRDFN
jgi:eukaryotic-like serine/threonine-protein kinase